MNWREDKSVRVAYGAMMQAVADALNKFGAGATVSDQYRSSLLDALCDAVAALRASPSRTDVEAAISAALIEDDRRKGYHSHKAERDAAKQIIDCNPEFIGELAGNILRLFASSGRTDVEADTARLDAEVEKWQEFTRHLSWCATCAEDGLSQCESGKEIEIALELLRAARSGAATTGEQP